MDIEKLNKTQIILLTLLTSFVTSIATGIVTVTLMDQAPPGVTHTISKVVEKTIETVVPEKTQDATVVKTIIVEQEDALAEAIAKNEQNLVKIKKDTQNENETTKFISVGFVISEDGLVVTDSAYVKNNKKYIVEFSDGSEIQMSIFIQSENDGIAILSMSTTTDITYKASPIEFAKQDTLALGKSVITLSGQEDNNIYTGLITKLKMSEREVLIKNTENNPNLNDSDDDKNKNTIIEKYLYAIYTNIQLKSSDSGSMLFDMQGHVLGMNLVREGVTYTVPMKTIQNLLNNNKNQDKKDEENDNSKPLS